MTSPVALALLALALPAQVPKEPAKDLFLHSLTVPGVEVRFVDYLRYGDRRLLVPLVR